MKDLLPLTARSNALDFLRRSVCFLKETENDVYAWKWSVIALHGALYGFAVDSAAGSYSGNVKYKSGKINSFWDVVKKCRSARWMRAQIIGKPLKLSESEEESLRLLNNLYRNNFMHFPARTLHGFYLYPLPQTCIDVLNAIRFIALETDVRLHLKPEERNEVNSLVENGCQFIRQTELYSATRQASEESA